MKPVLAIVSGFVLTLAVFASGIGLAMMTLSIGENGGPGGKVEDVADVWTSEPRRVERGGYGLERVAAVLPADAASPEPDEAPAATIGGLIGEANAGEADGVDPTTTASMAPDEDAALDAAADEVLAAHVGWCFERYRSYRTDDNTYQPYSGGRRQCASPYLDDLTMVDSGYDNPQAAVVGYAGNGGQASDPWQEMGLVERSPAHIRDCFNRYRSYRVEDNTYQPYGGGPRRQCE